jgi:predicted GNAT family N-acyltransferase
MMDITVFKGRDNPDFLRAIEQQRFSVWSGIVGNELARTRFAIDKFDPDAWHVVCTDDDKIIGSARLIVVNNAQDTPDLGSFGPYVPNMRFPAAFMNRMAVPEPYRSQGIGRILTGRRHDIAFSQNNVFEVWVEARTDRRKSLEQMGYVCMGISADESVVGDWLIFCLDLAQRRAAL